ncbi:MAG: NADH:ubiquinone oxidoreductase subunit N, partial [Pseudomonadota bacterium]|nr:NADH:ubiquinone oxidoreductase subunit N [Pseudomonadota bacterium]
MTYESLNAASALPEMFVAGMACLILVVALFLKPESGSRFSFWAAVATLLGGALLVITCSSGDRTTAFNGMFVDDALADVVKTAILLVSTGAFIYGRKYNSDRGLFQGE